MPDMMGYTYILYNGKEYIFHRGCVWSVQSILGSGLIPGGKQNDKALQAVFFTLWLKIQMKKGSIMFTRSSVNTEITVR